MITRLKLQNFRKFKNNEFHFEKPIVVIHGNNTEGKSSLLEAIYVLTNGHSAWGHFSDIFNFEQEQDSHFRVEADLELNGESSTYAFFKNERKRILQKNSQNTTAKKFFEGISSTIFNPELIEIIMISPSKRREFLDDVLTKVDIEFADISSKFNRVLRQRNAYLKKLSKAFFDHGIINPEDTQLKYWTEEFSKYSSAIISKRSSIVEKLKTKDISLEYKSTLSLNLFEDMSDLDSLAQIHFNALMEKARRDIATGHTNIGAHRDDWSITNGRDVKRYGSRGEKRVAIAKLIFQTQEIVAKSKGFEPYLLLDDIPSELDEGNTAFVLDSKILKKQQTFITTINIKSIPKEILKVAQVTDLGNLH